MNARAWLLNHPLILRSAAFMTSAGLTPDTICRSIDRALIPDLPNDSERGEVIRVLRRMVKKESSMKGGEPWTS